MAQVGAAMWESQGRWLEAALWKADGSVHGRVRVQVGNEWRDVSTMKLPVDADREGGFAGVLLSGVRDRFPGPDYERVQDVLERAVPFLDEGASQPHVLRLLRRR